MNKFQEKFAQIRGKIDGCHKNNKLEYAVDLWCEYANIPQNIIYKIKDARTILTTKTRNNKHTDHTNINLVETFIYNKLKDNMSPFLVTLISLTVIGIAYVIYLLNNPTQNNEEDEWDNESSSGYLSSTSERKYTQKYKLILAIDPSKSEFLESIRESKNIIADESICNKLFSATNYLWIGGVDSYIDLDEKNQLYSVKNEEYKNFDVFLIEIILDEYIRGFEKDVTKIARHEAFQKLVNYRVDISERLRFEAFSDLYHI